MEKYVTVAVIGEFKGGIITQCQCKDTDQFVVIKKFVIAEDDDEVRTLALREIRVLRKLQHVNLVNMVEVFRWKREFHLVFEHTTHNVLNELNQSPKGLREEVARKCMFQVIRGVDYCHRNGIIHRNIKPENILVSSGGVIKLGDLALARMVSMGNETLTSNLGSRWYRAPELLVMDSKYDWPVDIWAVGCVFSEMLTGEPLFSGVSDIDQLHQITSLFGDLCPRHLQLIATNSLFKEKKEITLEQANRIKDPYKCLKQLFPSWSNLTLDIVSSCLRVDPSRRASSVQLLHHSYFTYDNFSQQFLPEIRRKVKKEYQGCPLLSKFYMEFVEPSMLQEASAVLNVQKQSSQEVTSRWKLKISSEEDNRPY